MKRLTILLYLLISAIGAFAQDYYWYGDQKIFFQDIRMRMILSKSLRNDPEIEVTNRFFVKLKNENDYDSLMVKATYYNVESVAASSVPLWYILSCSENTNGTALSLANLFYESHQFARAEPEFIQYLWHSCVNDTYFSQQWYLNNTGQHGSAYSGWDINYCDAHTITSGNGSVVIALIDNGVDSTHQDIHQPVWRYDVQSKVNKDSLYASYGTAAAGIIGAYTNNNKGIAGIASDCSLMSISIPTTPLSRSYHLADAIMYAANNGASVINCPWSAFTPSWIIYDAIDYALVHGRNNLGCVVVFGSGNWGGPVMFPAETHLDNIVVGATSTCGGRKTQESCGRHDYWESCYGYRLDVMAPGDTIITSNNGNQYFSTADPFLGTSASCAQVSAIAGLVLSINPQLSQKEVGDIICSTARKVGNYNYDSIAPNGSWNMEMGYGFVDAYAAVVKAQLSLVQIEGPTYLCGASNNFYARYAPSGTTFQWHMSNSVDYLRINSSSNLDSVSIGINGHGVRDSEILEQGDDPKGINPHGPVYPVIRDSTAILSLTVTKDGISHTIQKNICSSSMGKPQILASDSSSTWPRYEPRTFTVTNCTEVPDNELLWTIRLVYPDYGFLWPWTFTGRTITFQPVSVGTYEVTVENKIKQCGDTITTKTYSVEYGFPAKGNGKVNRRLVMEESQQQEPVSTIKFIHNGQLYIEHQGKIYNAKGEVIR